MGQAVSLFDMIWFNGHVRAAQRVGKDRLKKLYVSDVEGPELSRVGGHVEPPIQSACGLGLARQAPIREA